MCLQTISDQTFEVAENISATDEIGRVVATDNDGDVVTFSITEDVDELFEITEGGILSLQEGKALDFETTTSHSITIEVTDGSFKVSATVTVEVTNANDAPAISDQTFEVLENISTTQDIGSVIATDVDGDNLEFSITEDVDELFEITKAGVISLIESKRLDFETKTEHTITVEVSDGSLTANATITITVKDAFDAFITVWETTSANESVLIPINTGFTYDYVIDWGDGTSDSGITGDATHTYEMAGTYMVSITGTFPAIRFAGRSAATKAQIKKIEQWGDIVWESFDTAFELCINLEHSAIDAPNLSNGPSLFGMFNNCRKFNGEIGHWDLSAVTNIGVMFAGARSFNGDISTWNVGNVTQMSNMFKDAIVFDQDIGDWDISSVTNLSGIFDNSGMSLLSYRVTLQGWADQPLKQSNLSVGAAGLIYCSDTPGRDTLINDHGWTFVGDQNVTCS